MSISESIKCDNCKKELICDTQYPHVYALELKAIDVNRNSSGREFCVYTTPPIKGTVHFCNKKCMNEFLNDI